ncbi:pentapeptide repeat-containing protein [Saccharomonospora sp. CUA-673]|uniref:pentapeptide repeat-containing protein n=1 Tax=Saccharomonospora sp. CUA-673 TaxID=1904969 RepID=UPI0021009699|nr:pentapeptide repeat-containing protein [Saccharomonospora sp. CUA-673]
MPDRRSAALHPRTIALWAVGLLLLAAVVATASLWFLGGGTAADRARLDALRTAASLVIGTGGGAALLLAARRQRSAELDLEQRDHDATERRVTELYGQAAEQVGHESAAVRLAGMYALERLATDHAPQRQTIVNVLCAYLRMPFDDSAEERQVRLAVQRILQLHLRPDLDDVFWSDIDLDLAGARLTWFSFPHCRIRSLNCRGAVFTELATFRGTEFGTKADFTAARFLDVADFRNVGFGRTGSQFRDARFEGPVRFGEHTTGNLAGAVTRTGPGRNWPPGWTTYPLPDDPDWAELKSTDP